MSVLSLSDVKAYLNVTSSRDDGEIQATIDAAEAAIARRVGPLVPTEIVATVTGPLPLALPTVPVLSLTSITAANGAAVSLAGVTVSLAAGVAAGSGLGFGTYTITYSAGRTDLPADLKLAVKELVRHLWSTQRNPALFPGSSLSEGPATPPSAAYLMPYRVQELLAPHALLGP